MSSRLYVNQYRTTVHFIVLYSSKALLNANKKAQRDKEKQRKGQRVQNTIKKLAQNSMQAPTEERKEKLRK